MPIVTISRGAKSGGIALAEKLSKTLGYHCISREVLIDSARRYQIDEETLAHQLESAPTFWQRLTKEQSRYLVFIRCALLQAVKDDNVVYHGRAGQFFLDGVKHCLKVRILAPLSQRVKTVMADLSLTHDKAVQYIEGVDANRRRWVQALYGKNWDDPSLYDLTINLAHLSLDNACATICRTLECEDFAPTADSHQHLLDMSLECEVKASLATEDDLWDQKLKVTAQGGKLTIRGLVKTEAQRHKVDEIVAGIEGVRDAEMFVSLLSDPLPHG